MRCSWAFSVLSAVGMALVIPVAASADDIFSEAGHSVVRDFARDIRTSG